MARARKLGRKTTKMAVRWIDKDLLSQYKQPKKWSESSKIQGFESDEDVFHRVITQYAKEHPAKDKEPKSTYLGLQNTKKTVTLEPV